jgi:pyroglutamyl-peptidase
MSRKILLTSFDTWMPHHQSNASDDLLEKVAEVYPFKKSVKFLRKLPVDFQLAPQIVLEEVTQIKPDVVICCGMAETRNQLSLESNAKTEHEKIQTTVNLENLVKRLYFTDISHHAGKFVCEALYYAVLQHLRDVENVKRMALKKPASQCLFVHVPVFTPHNTEAIVTDFLKILHHFARK